MPADTVAGDTVAGDTVTDDTMTGDAMTADTMTGDSAMAVIDPAIATAVGGPSWGAAVGGPIVTVPYVRGARAGPYEPGQPGQNRLIILQSTPVWPTRKRAS
jgi:hypothetical protein